MKKILALAVAIIAALTLFGCSNDDSIPDGMQLVNGGEELGYYFYAPEEWTVANLGNVDTAYASYIDNSSITFTEIDPATFNHSDDISDEAYFFGDYFMDSTKEFPEGIKLNITVKGEKCLFGTADEGADKAIKYVYEYNYKNAVYNSKTEQFEYRETPFGFMQILLSHEGRFYIFTYAAQKAKLNADSDEYTRYDYYIQNGKLDSVINNFKLIHKNGNATTEDTYEKDSDGFVCVTDKKIAGFDLYIPTEFKLDFASASVSATCDDGSNITLTKATSTGVSADTYWAMRKMEIEAIATDLEVIKEGVQTKLGNNSQWAFAYEYTYTYNGTKYHVYQILAVDGFLLLADGYVFTYTASEENYKTHFNAVEKIINKVNF